MARARLISPDFWSDGKVVCLSPFARLFFIGTWNFTYCSKGHLPDDATALKLKILPTDDVDEAALLEELLASTRVVRLAFPGNKTYLHVVNFEAHQAKDKYTAKSRCPVCALENPATLSETSESFGKDSEELERFSLRREEKRREEKKASPAGKKPELRLPKEWAPTAAHVERAAAGRIDVAREAIAFRLHAETHDRHAASWNAAFTTWLTKAKPSAPAAKVDWMNP